MYFSKKVHGVQLGLRESPQKLGSFENFCVKSNLTGLQSVRLLLTVIYRKNRESRMYYLLPNNFVGGEQVLPLTPCSYAYSNTIGIGTGGINSIPTLQPQASYTRALSSST